MYQRVFNKQYVILPMEALLVESTYMDEYEHHFVREIFELAFDVMKLFHDPHLQRNGIRWTLTGAIDQVICNFISGHPDIDYLSQEDYQIIVGMIDIAYHYIDHLFNVMGVDPDQEGVELIPNVWVNMNLMLRVQPY